MIAVLAAALTHAAAAPAQEANTLLLAPWTEVKWRSDYNACRKEASEKQRPLFIDFGTPGCYWCRKLDDTTFRDPRVIALLNDRFIPLKIDAEREVHLANVLRIESYPTIVLATADGKIHAYLKGYQDAEAMHEVLQRLATSIQAPESVQRDLLAASQKMQQGEYPAAIALLKSILDDPKGRALHAQSQKHLDAIERKASERIGQARDMHERGQVTEAIAHLGDTVRYFPGLEGARQADDLMTRFKEQSNVEKSAAARAEKARDLLSQAREFHKKRDLVPCLDRCATLIRDYIDLPEGQGGLMLMSEIKSNPALLQQAADSLSERLGEVYLALAESHLQTGQAQRAEYYFQRVVLACPGTRHAESAQVRLTQLQGVRPRGTGTATVGNPE
jgi:thioredoxin-like negative regulator of GroEL